MSLVLGRRDRRSVARFCDGQVLGRCGNIAPASVPFGTVVPSYGERDGKFMKPLERETGLEPATSGLGIRDSLDSQVLSGLVQSCSVHVVSTSSIGKPVRMSYCRTT